MKAIWTGVLMLLLFINLNAQDATSYEFSLEQAIDYAIENHPSLSNARLDEHIAEAQRKEYLGTGLPQVNGSVDMQTFVKLPTSLIPGEFFGGMPGEFIPVQFGTKYNASAGIEVSQLIFSSDYIMALQSSKIFLELASKNTTSSKIEIIQAVSKAYYAVLVNEERIKLLDANIDRLKKLGDDTKIMQETGFVEQIDVDRIQVAYNNLLTERQKVAKLIGLAATVLKFQMSMDLTANLSLTDKLDEADLTLPAESANTFDYNQRIEYDLLQTQQTLAELNVKRNKLSYLPTLVGFGSFTTQAQRQSFNFFDGDEEWFPTSVIGLSLSVPIFDGLQKKYRIDKAKLELTKVANGFEMLEQGIDLEVETAKTMWDNSQETVSLEKENMELAQRIYDTSVKKYNGGVGSNLEIMDAETSLKEAQTNYFSALYDVIIAKIDFLKAKGVLGQNY